MPIKIPVGLPAGATLEGENIFVMNEFRAEHQDIRPLKIAALNLMPTKITTETQLIRLLSNSSLQIEFTLLQTATHRSTHTSAEHMAAFYKNFDDIRSQNFDGLIITGAPVENLDFDEVNYWDELCEIMEWSRNHVFSTLHICWAAQAGLNFHYGIPKYPLRKKLFGVFEHYALLPNHPIVRGFDEYFLAPHSRHTEVRESDIAEVPSSRWSQRATSPERISSRRATRVCCSSPVMPSMTMTHWQTNTSATRQRGSTSTCHTIISRAIIRA